MIVARILPTNMWLVYQGSNLIVKYYIKIWKKYSVQHMKIIIPLWC